MTRFAKLSLLLIVAGAFALAGCGGDDNGGLSAEDQARIAAAEDAAAMAAAEAEQAKMDAAAAAAEAEQAMMDAADAEAEAEAAKTAAAEAEEKAAAAEEAAAEEPEVPEVDTSEIDAQIAELTQRLEDATATPMTPLEILGGTKSTASAADRAAMAEKIAGQLNMAYDHDMDEGMVNLPELMELGDVEADVDKRTRNVSHATAGVKTVGAKIMSSDGTSKDGGFLRHSFTGGPTIDLTSPGDIETLTLTNLLKVNDVDLKSFALKETDKIRTAVTDLAGLEAGAANIPLTPVADPVEAGQASHMTTTTLGADGSMHMVRKVTATGVVSNEQTTLYVDGSKIVENAKPAITAAVGAAPTDATPDSNAFAIITQADGTRLRFGRAADADTAAPADNDYMSYDPDPAAPLPATVASLPTVDLATALRDYAQSTVKPLQHNAKGYGAWLTDSFFVAYVMSAEDDDIISDPDDMVHKIAWGGRAHDSMPATNLSGRGETATWKGLMVGHDMDSEAATGGDMVKGNARIDARLGGAVLADPSNINDSSNVVDVSLTNIINDKGVMVERVKDGIKWTNLDLTGGSFAKGNQIMGQFYDSGDEVVGQFNSHKILGVFGAREYEMMDDAMDMAGN